MNCPACNTPVMVLEYAAIEVDYCSQCHGVWLDAGEIDLLLGDATLAHDFMCGGVSVAGPEAIRRCPLCRGKMKKETTRGDEPVTYDVCLQGHGMWFDQGELAAVLQFGTTSPGGAEVVKWLRDLFSAPDA